MNLPVGMKSVSFYLCTGLTGKIESYGMWWLEGSLNMFV